MPLTRRITSLVVEFNLGRRISLAPPPSLTSHALDVQSRICKSDRIPRRLPRRIFGHDFTVWRGTATDGRPDTHSDPDATLCPTRPDGGKAAFWHQLLIKWKPMQLDWVGGWTKWWKPMWKPMRGSAAIRRSRGSNMPLNSATSLHSHSFFVTARFF